MELRVHKKIDDHFIELQARMWKWGILEETPLKMCLQKKYKHMVSTCGHHHRQWWGNDGNCMADQLFARKKGRLYSKPKYQVQPLQQRKAFDAI